MTGKKPLNTFIKVIIAPFVVVLIFVAIFLSVAGFFVGKKKRRIKPSIDIPNSQNVLRLEYKPKLEHKK